MSKIKSLAELKRIATLKKLQGKKIVFTNGCFDILHYGHVMYLEKAKAIGDILIVGINSDASVRSIKGKFRPIVNEKDRAGVIAGLESVDYVVVFRDVTPDKLIRALKPDILVKGSDWKNKGIVGADFIKSYGGKVATVKLAKGRSSTNIIRKIIEAN